MAHIISMLLKRGLSAPCCPILLITVAINILIGSIDGLPYWPTVVFRHGARTLIGCETKMIPNNSESFYEPWGYSQLTKTGMVQEYQIGKMLREQYKDFLPEMYRPKNVYAYSSYYSRTKASLALLLAALYTPKGEQVWNYNLNWMPIPIHSVPRDLDILLKPRLCPDFIVALQQVYNSTEVKEVLKDYEDLIQMLKMVDKDFRFMNIICAYNAIVVQKDLNLALPSWYSDVVFQKIEDATKFYFDSLSLTPRLNRLNGGTLVRRFLENMNVDNGIRNDRKLYLYSAHDKNVHAFLKAHRIIAEAVPDYGSAVILEKLSDKFNRIYVRLLLWTGEPKKLKVLKLYECAEVCPMADYLKIIRPVLPTDDEMRCLLKNRTPEDLEKIFESDSLDSGSAFLTRPHKL